MQFHILVYSSSILCNRKYNEIYSYYDQIIKYPIVIGVLKPLAPQIRVDIRIYHSITKYCQ